MKINYSTFVEELARKLREKYGKDLQIEQNNVRKNNAVILRGILIREEGEQVAPNFYLDSWYEAYLAGEISMESLAEQILDTYRREKAEKQQALKQFTFTWEKIKDAVTCRLIHREKNADLLKTMPYEEFLDLALICQYTMNFSGEESGTILLGKEEIGHLGVDIGELFETAKKNMGRQQAKIYTMEEMLSKLCGEEPGYDWKQDESRMYVMTNQNGVFGAAVIAEKKNLRRAAKLLGSSYYVLPSSVHEVILIPEQEGITQCGLADIVREVNEETVEATEQLSDQVYFFDTGLDTLRRLGKSTIHQ